MKWVSAVTDCSLLHYLVNSCVYCSMCVYTHRACMVCQCSPPTVAHLHVLGCVAVLPKQIIVLLKHQLFLHTSLLVVVAVLR